MSIFRPSNRQLFSSRDTGRPLRRFATRLILSGAVAALLPSTGLGEGAVWYWTGNGNANLQNGPNWANAALVQQTANVLDFSDIGDGTGTNNVNGADALIFSNSERTFTNSTGGSVSFNATKTAVALNAPNGPNVANAYHTWRSITFEAGTLGYTIGPLATIPFLLGDSTTLEPEDAGPLNANTGNITNNSDQTQTFNQPVEFRFGTIAANEGAIVFQQAVNIGHNLVEAANNVIVTGSSEIPGRSVVTFNGALQGLGTDTSDGGALIKQGTGTLRLNGNNSAWEGRIQVDDGVVEVSTATALGSAAGRTTIAGDTSTGIVRLNTLGTTTLGIAENFHLGARFSATAPHIEVTGGNFTLGGTITLDEGGGGHYGLRVDGGSLNVAGEIVYGSATGGTNLHLTGTGSGTISSNLGTGGLEISVIKEGSGTWTLSGANAYTGLTQVNQGRLNIYTSQTGGGDIELGDLATLGITLGGVGQTLNVGSLSLGSTTGGIVEINLAGLGNVTTPIITASSLSTNGGSASTLTVRGIFGVGTIPLIDYSGSISGNGFAGLTLANLPPRTIASLANDTTNTVVNLNITQFDYPRWTGAVSDVWDINNGTDPTTGSGTVNWRETNSGTATRYLQSGTSVDSVLFDDTASGTGDLNVTIAANVSPVTLTVKNTDRIYTFSGPGKITGETAVSKQDSGTWILANTGGNDYTGPTTVNGGVLQIGDGFTPGGGQLGSGPVTNNASIVLNRAAGEVYTIATNIGGNSAGSITKLGDNTVVLSGVNSFDGVVTVSEGTLKLGSNFALGSGVGGTVVESGAALDVGDFQAGADEVVTISGVGAGFSPAGALTSSGPTGGAGTGIHHLALAADATIGGSRRFDVTNGSLDGGGFTLTKTGANIIHLANLGETQLGNVVIESGRLSFDGTTTLGAAPGTVQILADGELGLEDSTVVQTKAISLQGGKISFTSGLTNELGGPLTLAPSVPNAIQGPSAATTLALLTISGNIDGGGALGKTQSGAVVLTGTNTYSGGTAITGGGVIFAVPQSVPSVGTIGLGAGSTVGFGFDVDQAFLSSHLTPTANAATLALGVSSSQDYDFAAFPSLSLGTYGTVTYSGTLKPGGTTTSGAYYLGGGTGTITVTSTLTGSNTLNIGTNGSGGTVILTGDNSYAGRTTVSSGSTLILGSSTALGLPTNPLTNAGLIDLNGNDLTVGGLTAAQNVATIIITDNSTTPGVTTLTDNIASGSTTYGSKIQDGAVRQIRLVKAGDGRLILNGNSANTYTGGTTISGGFLEVRTNQTQSLPPQTPLTFTGTGTFDGANNSNSNVTLLLGNLTFQSGEGTILSNNFNNGTGSQNLSFTGVPTRAAGATGVFALNQTSNSATYKVTFAGTLPVGQSLNGGLFYTGQASDNKADFAVYDAAGYVRALNYLTDPTARNVVLTEDSFGFGTDVTGRDVQVSGGYSISDQGSATLRTLKVDGPNTTLNLIPGSVLTLTNGGLLKTGGGTAVIGFGTDESIGGDGLTTGGAQDLVIRTALTADILEIKANIIDSTTGGLTKSGAGTLILSGTGNTFTGGIWLNGGTLRFTGANTLPATGAIRLGSNTVVGFSHAFDQAFLAERIAATTNLATIALGSSNSNSLDFSSETGLNLSGISLGSSGTFTYSGTLTPYGGTYRLGGGGGTLTFSSLLSGTNSLVVGGSGSSSTVVLNQANTYSGGTTVVSGTLRIANASALGSATGKVTVNGGTLDLRGFNQTLYDLSGSGGTITDTTPGAPATTSVTVNIPRGSRTYSGSINNGGTRILQLIKEGLGSLILSKANGNTYSGGTVIRNGRLEVRTNSEQVLAFGSPLTFEGTGTFAAGNNGAADVTTAGLSLGALTFQAGDATIESNQLNASTTNVLTFSDAPVRAVGATGNFTLSVANDPSLYKVVFSTASATGQSISGGLFYNYTDFLTYDAAGYARGLHYTGTPDANAADVPLVGDQSTLGTGLTGKDVQLGGVSGATVTAQTSETLRTLKFAGQNNLILDGAQTLTISSGGVLKTGEGAATISGGAGITTDGAADLVFRVDRAGDTLTVATPILASTGGGVTKTGLGTLVLGGSNEYDAPTYINNGTLLLSGSITGSHAVLVNRGGTLGGTGTITTDAGVIVAEGGSLSPGLELAAGTLHLQLGTGQLNLSQALGSDGWLYFQLGEFSDSIELATGTLNLGLGLDFADFSFSDAGGLVAGTYTLFDTNTDILGDLGTNLTGNILGPDGFEGTLSFSGGLNGRDDLILTVVAVPEPGTLAVMLSGVATLLLHRRRRRILPS